MLQPRRRAARYGLVAAYLFKGFDFEYLKRVKQDSLNLVEVNSPEPDDDDEADRRRREPFLLPVAGLILLPEASDERVDVDLAVPPARRGGFIVLAEIVAADWGGDVDGLVLTLDERDDGQWHAATPASSTTHEARGRDGKGGSVTEVGVAKGIVLGDESGDDGPGADLAGGGRVRPRGSPPLSP